MKYYANTLNGKLNQDLNDHLHGVMLMAIHCAKKLGITDPGLISTIGFSAFCHDLGKCSETFQEETLKNNYVDYPRHNEVSWLWAATFAKDKSTFKKIGLQAIYWHHATRFNFKEINERSAQSIKNEMPDLIGVFDRINDIVKNANFPFEVNIKDHIDAPDDDLDDLKIPRLYTDGNPNALNNAQKLITRSCVIYADHLVSALTVEELSDIVNNNNAEKYFPSHVNNINCSITLPSGYDQSRFDVQRGIVADCGRITQVNAPAGFGKTMIGLLWGIEQLKEHDQVYWVCPRNVVAETVYANILSERDKLGLNISVELYLSSERKKGDPNIGDCKSNIIVTNIDNLLAPMVNSKTKRIFDINMSNTIFDEFHEFIGEEALFGAFIVFMQSRASICKSTKTLLLSATPSLMHHLWDTGLEKTKILPNPGKHYPAQHKKNYIYHFDKKVVPTVGTLHMFSSIKSVQEKHSKIYDEIIHSKFSQKDREIKMKNILSKFDKNGDKQSIVISAPILQAALDISFKSLIKTTESPENDIQTIGRVNRWGEQEPSDIYFNHRSFNTDIKSNETGAIKVRYNLDLSDQWNNYLKFSLGNKPGSQCSLDELYEMYNDFNTQYKNDLLKYLQALKCDSIKGLTTFFPRERVKNKNDKENTIFTGKSLRSVSPSYFIVVKGSDGKWCDFTFSITNREVKEILTDNRKYLEDDSTIKNVIDILEKIDIDEKSGFDYSDLNIKKKTKNIGNKMRKKVTAEDILSFARCNSSPLPVFSKIYDSKLGLKEK